MLAARTSTVRAPTSGIQSQACPARKVMSAIVAATCSRCTGILLEEEIYYALENLSSMTLSDCPGCHFFLLVARIYGAKIAFKAKTYVFLRRRSGDGNYIDVVYVQKEDPLSSVGRTHKLRLCATFGMCLMQCRPHAF